MADTGTPRKPSPEGPAESPTTARPIDFDDDQQETGVISREGASSPTPKQPPRTSSLQRNVRFEEEEAPPTKPPRPANRQAEAENTLKEAFPAIDMQVIKAVLTASGGQVEPAFNALLGMSDPNFKEEAPPTPPPRPPQQQRQLQQDEQYARQLAQHYNSQQRPRAGDMPAGARQGGRPLSQEEEREYSFFDDDLPEIRENLRQGFLTTQRSINKWVTDIRKKIDGDEEAEEGPAMGARPQQRQSFGQSSGAPGANRTRQSRQSTDRDQFDADPHVIGDDFAELELHDAEADEKPPPKPARPHANPDLFKPTPPAPSGPVDEVDALYRQETPKGQKSVSPSAGGSANKGKKWQPLTSVAPAPDAEEDPFTLHSDDEEDKKEDINKAATERLKARAASVDESKKESGEGKKLEESERSGSVLHIDKAAEDLMKDEKKT